MAIYNPCEKCVTDRSLCDGCNKNPKYADYPHKSLFKAYNPTCPIGKTDCIGDPAYIKHHYPNWYKDIYGDLTPEQASEKSCKKGLENGLCRYYDDEDK